MRKNTGLSCVAARVTHAQFCEPRHRVASRSTKSPSDCVRSGQRRVDAFVREQDRAAQFELVAPFAQRRRERLADHRRERSDKTSRRSSRARSAETRRRHRRGAETLAPFGFGVGVQRERMNRIGQFVGSTPLTRRCRAISRWPSNSVGDQHHLEVAFRARRHAVIAALVDHFEVQRRQRFGELRFDRALDVMVSAPPRRRCRSRLRSAPR